VNAWHSEAVSIVNRLLGGRNIASLAGLGMATLTCLFLQIMLKFTAKASGVKKLGWLRILLSLALGLGVALAFAVAVSLYVCPLIPDSGISRGVLIGMPVVVSLGVAIPLQMVLLQGSYGQVLFAYVAALIAAALFAMGVSAAIESASFGEGELSRIKQRTSTMERGMGK